MGGGGGDPVVAAAGGEGLALTGSGAGAGAAGGEGLALTGSGAGAGVAASDAAASSSGGPSLFARALACTAPSALPQIALTNRSCVAACASRSCCNSDCSSATRACSRAQFEQEDAAAAAMAYPDLLQEA